MGFPCTIDNFMPSRYYLLKSSFCEAASLSIWKWLGFGKAGVLIFLESEAESVNQRQKEGH